MPIPSIQMWLSPACGGFSKHKVLKISFDDDADDNYDLIGIRSMVSSANTTASMGIARARRLDTGYTTTISHSFDEIKILTDTDTFYPRPISIRLLKKLAKVLRPGSLKTDMSLSAITINITNNS